MRLVRLAQFVLVLAAAGLVISGAVLLGLATKASGTSCTFDNFSCKSNRLLGDSLRCFAGAVLLGTCALSAPWIRRHRSKDHPAQPQAR